MKLSAIQIVQELNEKSQMDVGRHLYAILGSYAQLANFEQNYLPKGFAPAQNLNLKLLGRIGDADLLQLTKNEANYPQAIQRKLNQELDGLLGCLLQENRFLTVKQMELLFAYELDLSVLRTRASNQNHLLLLLPGERRGDHVALFHEAPERFRRTIPETLIASNHLWEMNDG